ncbi:MAG: nucleoside deaminase [Tissierellia bacterium]|nr:nucleoside deaminase [Tissierellia bacterium]
MKEALKEAEKAYLKEEIPIGCVIVKDGKIIGRGHNQKREKNCANYHAEMIAIKAACKNINHWWLEDAEIYITLEPCAMCAGAILNARIAKAFIAAKDLRMGCAGTVINLLDMKSFNHKTKVEFGILERESKELIAKFFKELRDKKANEKLKE